MRTLFHFYKNRSEWINEFYHPLQTLWRDKKVFLIMSSGLLALLVFAVITIHKSMKMTDLVTLQNKRSEVILNELDDIHSILHDVENNPLNSKQQQMALRALENDIVSTQKSMVNMAKTADIQKISGQITSVKDDMDAQMKDIKKLIPGSAKGKELLDASALPFHVISVDVIAQEAYVSVEYDNHIFPLAVGDVLTGWRVANADYESAYAEFVNEKDQYVKISLQGG